MKRNGTASPSSKSRIVAIGAVALAALAVGGYLIVNTNASAGVQAAVGPATAVAAQGSVVVSVQAISVAEPASLVTLRNRQAGQVRSILPEGSAVAAGDPVVVMDDAELRKSLSQAELGLKQAQVNLERALAAESKARADLDSRLSLFAAKAATQEQLDLSRDALASAEFARRSAALAVEQASLALEQARRELAEAVVRSPIAGVVAKPAFSAGDFAPANSQLATVADLSKLLFKAEVDEYDIGKLREGMPASVKVPALADEAFRARVERISPIAEIVSAISVFKVSVFVDNAEGRLRPGMSADLSFTVSNEKGVVVPLKAVTTVRGRSYVDVLPAAADAAEAAAGASVAEGGAANGIAAEPETRRVEIGSNDGRNVIVAEGLEVGETVVLPGVAPAAPIAEAAKSSGSSIIPISVPGTGGGSR